MIEIKTAKGYISGESPIWAMAEKCTFSYSNKNSEMVVIDSEWLQSDESERENDDAMALAKVLDSEPSCKGWREFDLLYLWCI